MSDSGDFAESLADPCKGFPDADNMVPGEESWGWGVGSGNKGGRGGGRILLLAQTWGLLTGAEVVWHGMLKAAPQTQSSCLNPFGCSIDHLLTRAGYVLGPVLGKGGFCSVRKALHEVTGQAVACKIIEKGKLKVRWQIAPAVCLQAVALGGQTCI